MKKCEGCGAYYSDFDRICPHCGREDASLAAEEESRREPEKAPETGEPQEAPEWKPATWEPADSDGNEPFESPHTEGQKAPAFKMKWHMFMMITMIVGAVLTVVNAYEVMTFPQESYGAYPQLKTYDTIYGIACIATAVFQLLVRNRLNAFRKEGPKLLMILYGVNLAVNGVYMLGVRQAFSGVSSEMTGFLDTQLIVQSVAIVVMAGINWNYYRKRKSLFVN